MKINPNYYCFVHKNSREIVNMKVKSLKLIVRHVTVSVLSFDPIAGVFKPRGYQ